MFEILKNLKTFQLLLVIIFISCTVPDDSSVQETTTESQETTTTTESQDTTTTTESQDTTTTTVAPSTDVNCGNLADSPFVDDEKIRVFAASDLNQETVNSTLEFANEAYDLWMSEEYYGICQAKAIYLMITGSDIDAGRKANQEFCDFLKDMKYKSAEWCSNDTSDGYVRNGGAGINSNGPVEGFYFMVMGPRGNNFSNSYKTMAYHEVIHIYQISNIYSRTWDEADTKMGKRTGDDPNIDVAWWAEGNADFLAALYSSDLSGDFRKLMRDALESKGPFVISRKEKYIGNKQKLYNISWDQGDTVDLAYRIGSWFTAYLVHNHGEQSIYDFWENVDKDSFDNTFIKVFGKDYRTYTDEFDVWLQQSNSELYKILDPIYDSKIKKAG